MAVHQYLDTTLKTTVIASGGAALVAGARKIGDYDNTTDLALLGDVFLTLHYSSAPAAGTNVAELYLLPGDAVSSPNYPTGGDGTSSTNNIDPQKCLLIGMFESRVPHTSNNERLCIPGIPLSPRGNRFLLKNVSAVDFATGYTLELKPYKTQVV